MAPETKHTLRKLARGFLLGLGLCGALFLLAALGIAADGWHDQPAPADVAIVLGARVERSGEPGPSLRSRLEKARELYEAELFEHVIVSGGLGREGHDEALVMRAYLVERGLPEEQIYVDSAGLNTYATARHAAAIMEDEGFESALIVSQFFHLPRARLALERFGVSEIHTARADLVRWQDPYYVAREVVAYVTYCFRAYE